MGAAPVHRLHAIPRRALHEVVDRAERDDAFAARIGRESDIGEVRAREELRLGIAEDAGTLLHDAHERLAGIALPVDLPQVLVLECALHVDVSGGENAAHELDGGHREIDARTSAGERELLLDLRGVTMPDRSE